VKTSPRGVRKDIPLTACHTSGSTPRYGVISTDPGLERRPADPSVKKAGVANRLAGKGKIAGSVSLPGKLPRPPKRPRASSRTARPM
jgi:hypothetical protein